MSLKRSASDRSSSSSNDDEAKSDIRVAKRRAIPESLDNAGLQPAPAPSLVQRPQLSAASLQALNSLNAAGIASVATSNPTLASNASPFLANLRGLGGPMSIPNAQLSDAQALLMRAAATNSPGLSQEQIAQAILGGGLSASSQPSFPTGNAPGSMVASPESQAQGLSLGQTDAHALLMRMAASNTSGLSQEQIAQALLGGGFSAPPRPALGPASAPVSMVRNLGTSDQGLPVGQTDAHAFLMRMAANNRPGLSQEQLAQAILGGSLGAPPRPAMAAASATPTAAGSLETEAQALLAATRLHQAQAALPSLQSFPQSSSSSIFPGTGTSGLGLPSSLGNALAAASSMAQVTDPAVLGSQLRAAQLLSLQSQMAAAAGSPPTSSQQQVDPTQLVLQGLAAAAAPVATMAVPPPSAATATAAVAQAPPSEPIGRKARSAAPHVDPPSSHGSGTTRRRRRPSSPKKDPPKETFLAVAGALPPPIPPAVEGSTPPYEERVSTIISVSTDEDQNWLSDFQCFIRSEILEIFRASHEDVQIRNNSKTLQTQQIGIRCRFCAHLPPSARASRSSAFPSSIPQIYQSFTMMLRDHWTSCQSIPSPQKEKFAAFKTRNNQGASDSKNYWMHAARRSGMVNTAQGIDVTDASRAAAARIPPFGTNSDTKASLLLERDDTAPLVLPEDRELLQDQYWYVLLQQVQRVRLSASERVGNRKSLRIGLPGFGCRYCCQAGRLGLSRIFPARRRTLPGKIPDIHDHLKRCPLCPQSVKDELEELEKQRKQNEEKEDFEAKAAAAAVEDPAGKEKEFFTRIWSRLGHGNKPEPS